MTDEEVGRSNAAKTNLTMGTAVPVNPNPPPAPKEMLAGNVLAIGLNAKECFPHYFKYVGHLDYIDVNRVITLFGVNNPALENAIKKLLASGNRGAKDFKQDLTEAVTSICRALAMAEEDLQDDENIPF